MSRRQDRLAPWTCCVILGLAIGVGISAFFWAPFAFLLGGMWAAGWTLIALACCEFAIGILWWIGRPPKWLPIKEDRVGEIQRNGHLRLARSEYLALVKYRAELRRAA